MLTYFLGKLHTNNVIINPITKCLFSLHTCINLLTNILLPIVHLPQWVNMPTNILGTIKPQPSNLPCYLPFNTTKLPFVYFAKPIFKPLFSLYTLITNQPVHTPLNPPLIHSLIAHLESMPYFLEDITQDTMHLAPSGLNCTQEGTST